MKCILTVKNYLVLAIIFCLVLTSNKTFASHAMGADLTYECLGGNDYKVTLKFYRDCEGIAAPASATIDINSVSCGQSIPNLALTQIVGPNLVPTVCASQPSTCQGGTLYGAQEFIYEATVTLPASCQDWVVSYGVCCRNAAITTITNAQNYDLYIETSIDNSTASICNDSPVFGSLPILVACVGEPLNYNHGVYETEGDSLEFSLASGLDNATTVIPYAPPLSGTTPLFSSTPITINPLTGAISITPSIAQVGVISVLVEEYRNGVKIGDVTRDIQIAVVDCMGNSAPIVSGINGTADLSGTTGSYSMLVAPGNSFCFDLAAFDAEADNITLTSIVPSGATFTSNPLTNTATFCWSPTAADIGIHLLTVTAEDDGCTFIAKNSYVYAIKVTNNAPPCQLTGKVNYWNDTNRILAGLPGNNETEVYASNSSCGLMVPSSTPTIVDANGEFVHDMINGDFLHINREVDNTNCDPSWGVIEANDAFLANVFANNDPNFVPNPYQVIAMDVDMNGVVDTLDANQILDRSLSTICEFSQVWTTPILGPSKDWLFSDVNTAAGLDYTISTNFPAPDSTGYSNSRVPNVPACLDADVVSNCFPSDVLNVQACLLGDVDGNWDAVVDAPIFFTNTPYDFVINLDLATAEYVDGECVFTVDVNGGLPGNLKSFNFDIDYDETTLSLLEILPGNSVSTNGRMKWNNTNPDKALLGAFANQYDGFVLSGPVFSLKFSAVNNTINPSDLGVIRVRKNGTASDILLEGMAVGCTSSNEDLIRESVKINPNPATQSTVVNYASFQNEIKELTLWNTQGQLIRTMATNPSGQTEIQLSEYPAGVYILRVNEFGFRLLVLD